MLIILGGQETLVFIRTILSKNGLLICFIYYYKCIARSGCNSEKNYGLIRLRLLGHVLKREETTTIWIGSR